MADYLTKRGANIAPSYTAIADLPATTQAGDLVFVGGQLGIAVDASTFNTCDKTDITITYDWANTAQQAKVQASDGAAGDYFGFETDISGDTMICGAYAHYSSRGAAYVFTRSGTSWSQQAKLTASDAAANDSFGAHLSIDGDTAAISAYGDASYTGSAYIFTRSGTSWSQQAKITASDGATNDLFGGPIVVKGDTAVVAAYYGNAAYVFTRSGTSWSQQQILQSSDIASGDYFGRDVDISGETVIVGAERENAAGTNGGSAYIFTRSGTTWSQQAKLTGSDAAEYYYGGRAVAIDGDTVVVGYPAPTSHNGEAYVFTRSGTTWSQQAKLTASDGATNDQFGGSVAIEGDTIVIGAPNASVDTRGATYIFTRSGTSWTQTKKLETSDYDSNDRFGEIINISGNTIVGGTGGEDTGGNNKGSAYVFVAP